MSAIIFAHFMSIRIVRAAGDELERWDSYVDRSVHASPFHRRPLLDSLANHYDLTWHPLVGYKGEEPLGLLPLFETKEGPFTTVASPPSNTGVAYLGPIRIADNGRKQRKIEKEQRRFIDGVIDWIDTEIDPELVQIRCVDGFTDVRPFLWNGFDVTPSYTYIVDLERESDALLASFSSDARRSIRRSEELDIDIEVGGPSVIEPLNDLIRSRLEEKGVRYDLSADLLTSIYDELGSERVRPYVCLHDGDVVGGTLVLKEGETLYGWVGGATPTTDLPINEAVDWQIMQDGIEEGLSRYDLHGAMEQGVTEYKSKFDPVVTPLFEVTRKSAGAKAAAGLIEQMPESIQSIVR